MRVLVTADAVGGVWRYALGLATALRPLGVEAIVALLGPAPSAAQRREAEGVTLIDTGLPLDWLSDGPDAVLAAGEAIARLAAKHRVDLVQLNMPSLGQPSARFGMPVVAVAHGCVGTWWQAAKGSAPDPDYAWADTLVREGLLAADAIVAPSASYAATVARHHRLPELPLVVHNGRMPIAIADADAADHVFTAGRLWDSVKNTPLLDCVAALLPVAFRAAGSIEGPHGERVATAYLHLLGSLDERGIARELASRPIFVSAACFEPFGLAVLEAASAGCPLVLSGIDTFRELWTGAALFVEREDDNGYFAAIERIRADAGLRKHLGEAAQLRSQRYTPHAMAEQMAAIYARLLAVPKQAAA